MGLSSSEVSLNGSKVSLHENRASLYNSRVIFLAQGESPKLFLKKTQSWGYIPHIV
jgi:hypothetical protein